MTEADWSEWRSFPDPRQQGILVAPFGPGVYVLRHRSNGQGVLFGQSSRVAARMMSLLPAPLGCGNRNNTEKRLYVLEHLADMEYRTLACPDRKAAKATEDRIKALRRTDRDAFIFWT